ncbi:HAD-IA family hydrolase [Streptomyces clavuligerus]|uniref:HAD-superfamily hydrolase, subfamily IA, variant 3 n=1 Tax=Streptomyces clavuligerus TaxID=1901 RepID=B5GMF7_STRCL|nr:HAD-IA family hydrolase [Streptomyces clavuligerus]ANW22372.1 haloacid dehalogenase [Streptomyces clavuligerus]AXU17276.1 HAD family hydrolase [Streptomyces clavuligerus]EDY47503.1 HAD-superfamily hydrolase [Streptomyces clavuligerus]EFG04463.1 HAD-superfamily hydrolase, subfamily IA, variant 3 [Streptomyces clavuligerus]MBY6307079.1 HAD-IA family hydrolase [Streptomyces clavuligerus]
MIRLTVGAVLFDLDGVLVDSTEGNRRAWHTWAASHGIDGTATFSVGHGLQTVDHIRLVAPGLATRTEVERLDALEEEHSAAVTAQRGTEDLASRLAGMDWGIVTSCSSRAAAQRLATAGLPYPPTLVCADDVSEGKPSPEGYLLGARRLGADPSAVVVFEDAPAGVTAAKKAGMRVVALTTTHASARLTAADWQVEDLSGVGFDTRVNGREHTLTLHAPGERA